MKIPKELYIPYDEISHYLFSLSPDKWNAVLNQSITFNDNNHPVYVKINSTSSEPLNWFDKLILSACIAQQQLNIGFTTLAIIWRSLGIHTVFRECHRQILSASVEKLRNTNITIECSDKNQPIISNTLLPVEVDTSYTKQVRGHNCKYVIYFLEESPISQYARINNQVLKVNSKKHISIPNLDNNMYVIKLKTYLYYRIKLLTRTYTMYDTIMLDTILNECGLPRDNKVIQFITLILEYYKNSNILADYEFIDKYSDLYVDKRQYLEQIYLKAVPIS